MTRLSRLNLKQQLVAVVLMLVITAGITIVLILSSEHRLSSQMDTLLDHDVVVMDKAHQLNLAVVQVQQWLTDISATRGKDGLNDGFDEAEAQARRFRELLTELQQIDPAGHEEYGRMLPAFESYYAAGKRMATAYVEGGPDAGNALMSEFDAAAEKLSDEIQPFLQKARERVATQSQLNKSLSGNLLLYTSIGSISFALVVALMAWLFRNIFHTIGHDPGELERIAASIAAGDLDTRYTGEEQAGGVYRALLEMRNALREQMVRMQQQLTENGRMRSALDNADVAITVSDEDNILIYMNNAARRLFEALAPTISRAHPGFRVDKLIGGRLRDYFDDEKAIAAFSRPLQETIRIDTRLGDRHIRFVASPVYDEQQTYLGRVTQWTDRTEEVEQARIEAERLEKERREAEENARIRAALDKVGSAVMVADADYNIIYLNEALEQLFREAEPTLREVLPNFDASSLRGANMDLFHKDRRHQRALLDNAKGTVSREIEVAGLTLKIVANPVFDENGQRLGTAVEWTNRTEEVAVEREIDGIVAAARRGELDRRISLDDKEGFFRQLAVGMNELLEEIETGFSDIARVMRRMAEGDLTKTITRDYAGTFGQVKEDVNKTIANIEGIVRQLRESADSISTAAAEITAGNTNLSARTEQQASALEETASSMEELTSTVRNNADNAHQADQVAGNASQLATRGGEVVSRAVGAMREINDSSAKIAEIISVIDEIAFQTNLLALNASVEAARAGEQGRGFAVVATEVRNLASRSAEAAKEIKELIQDSVSKVKVGSELVDESGNTLEEIVVAVKKVGDIIAEIAAASAEQSAGIEQVNRAVTSMDEVTQQNAALAEQTSAASAQLNEKARELERLVGFFNVNGMEAPKQEQPTAPAPVAAPTPPAKPAPAPRPAARPVVATAEDNDDEWEEF